MKKYLIHLFLLFCLPPIFSPVYAQQKTIAFELNEDGNSKNSTNPFQKFVGAWTLKADSWTQNWGNSNETIKIPNHHTVSTSINTPNSLLSIIDGPPPNGHIFWSYNPISKEVQHLSSFGESRAGKGKGTINENGDLHLKLTFEGEPVGTYRKYTYRWINSDEYELQSVQFDSNHQPTGLFYGGNFIRVKKQETPLPIKAIKNLLAILDDNDASMETKLNSYTDDLIHMAPDNEVINNKSALKTYLEVQQQYGYSDMEHQIIEVLPFEDLILMRGQVLGTFHPSNGAKPFDFQTKNIFVFKWIDQQLKIWKIIYNHSPVSAQKVEEKTLEQQLATLNQQISRWYQQQQVDSIIQFYDKKVTFMPEYKPALYDVKSVSNFYKDWWSTTTIEKYQKNIFEVYSFDNYVVEIGTFELDYTQNKSNLKEYDGKYMILWQKSNTGQWTILSEIFNANKYLKASESPYATISVKETTTLPQPNVPTTLKEEILERNKWLKKVVETGDGPARVKGFMTDAVYLPHFQPMKIGLAEIEPYLLKIYRPEAKLYTNQHICQIYDFGDFVLTNGHYKGGWGSENGGTFEGNMMNLYKRNEAGKLLMYRQLTNNDR